MLQALHTQAVVRPDGSGDRPAPPRPMMHATPRSRCEMQTQRPKQHTCFSIFWPLGQLMGWAACSASMASSDERKGLVSLGWRTVESDSYTLLQPHLWKPFLASWHTPSFLESSNCITLESSCGALHSSGPPSAPSVAPCIHLCCFLAPLAAHPRLALCPSCAAPSWCYPLLLIRLSPPTHI